MGHLIMFPIAKTALGGIFEAAPDGVLMGNKLMGCVYWLKSIRGVLTVGLNSQKIKP